MKKTKQSVIIVTAYGEDNYFQPKYEDLVGIYTSVDKAICGAMKDGMTNKQKSYLDRMNAFYTLSTAMRDGLCKVVQVEYEEEKDNRCKPCTSSYQFRTFTLD